MKKQIQRLMIQPCSKCNFECSYCYNEQREFKHWRKLENKRVPLDFPFSVLEKLFSEYETQYITFGGRGETTLCPNILEALYYTFENGNFDLVDLSTNATGRSLAWFIKLIDTCIEKNYPLNLILSVHLEYDNYDKVKQIVEYVQKKEAVNKFILTVLCVVTEELVDKAVTLFRGEPRLAKQITFQPSVYETEKFEQVKQLLQFGLGFPLDFQELHPSQGVTEYWENTVSAIVEGELVKCEKWEKDKEPKMLFIEKLQTSSRLHIFTGQDEDEVKQKLPKIRICMPFSNNSKPHSKTENSLNKVKNHPLLNVDICVMQGSSISLARNAGLRSTDTNASYQKYFPFDYYLSLDSDIAFEPEQLLALIERDKDIIGGAYPCRRHEGVYVAGDNQGIEGLFEIDDFIQTSVTGLQEVDWIGAGFTLIKADVFKKMKYPWYREVVVEFMRGDKECSQWVGEDVGFCIMAKRAGFQIYCDCDVVVEHLTHGESAEKELTLDEIAEQSINALRTLEGNMKMLWDGSKALESMTVEFDTLNKKIEDNVGAKQEDRGEDSFPLHPIPRPDIRDIWFLESGQGEDE